MTHELTSLDLGISETNKYKIHPSVIINILDVYYRNSQKEFLIGILMGHIHPDFVSVTNVIFVPYEKDEEGETEIFTETLNKLLEHNSKIYNATRVGWFITKSKIDVDVGGLHSYFTKFLKSPTQQWLGPLIFLIDPSLETKKIEYKGYVQIPNKLYSDTFSGFQPVSIEIDLMKGKFASVSSILYDGLDPEKKMSDYNNVAVDYYGGILGKLKKLKDDLAQLDKEVPDADKSEILKRIGQCIDLKFDFSSQGDKKNAQKLKENNFLVKYHADLAQTQVLLNDKLTKVKSTI